LTQIGHQIIPNKKVIAIDVLGNEREAFSVLVDKIKVHSTGPVSREFFVSPGSFEKRSKVFGTEVGGIIGANFFKDRILVIDYENHQYSLL
jgi:hypothetical protein